ncbi:type I-E CRISPR-associated protein Cas7/Cse4/CasC [Leptolyngbya sp. FACHB-321]|uniref:type I-E CRISPR-associated protein Cas7/Cse4/CasC n=1 Tax=Leptolyngbya sp. FACHB-321 TaxID=2692807 RepID=UPI0016825C01|nr:type I-E CRISPR-associated protein Cas7/Cse4/CasC [Leptolyngbya sp. FACHB-321]MBD2037760.1 type I-E CRISPR-associated protein Cas7/Cse4/CasC [Leptolyngbya sp. FACHB-321]
MNTTKLGHFLTVHWIQTLPISNPNRDRSGAPKTTYYGGSMRGRISSQSWSRQVRETFNEKWEGDAGNRSRLWADRLAQKLQDELEYERTDALMVAFLMLSATGAKTDKAETFRAGQTDVLMFLSNTELEELVAIARRYQPQLDQALVELRPNLTDALNQGKAPSFEISGKKSKDKKKKGSEEVKPDLAGLKELHERVQKAIIHDHMTSAADVALFGRFLASLTDANIDGSLSRAHMVTTHSVAVETDFWTAMDDFSNSSGGEEEESTSGSGAGHLGDRPQTSGVYACSCAIDLGQLQVNLGEGGDVKKVIRTFLPALITASRGKGYIHQFHHRSLPNLFMVELTESCPLNCLVAFEKPVELQKKEGYLERSVRQLDTWWHDQNTLLDGLVKTQTCAVVEPSLQSQLSHVTPHLEPSYGALLETVLAWLEG